jgi:hypothetical protein
MSALTYCRAEDVAVLAIVVAELELRNIQRQVFLADLVERADTAPFEDRPEAFNRVRVNCTNDVFAAAVLDDGVRVFLIQMPVAGPLVSHEKADFVRHGFTNEAGQDFCADSLDNAGDYVAFTLHRADHGRLTGADAAAAGRPVVSYPACACCAPCRRRMFRRPPQCRQAA